MSDTNLQTYDKLAHVLEDIHSRFPDDAFSNRARLKGLLADHLPDAEREIRIVLDTIDEGVVDILQNSSEAERGMQIDRLVRRLESSRGIREDIARRVIQAFAFCLGVGDLPSSIPVTPAPPAPAETGDGGWIGVSEVADSPPGPDLRAQPTPQPAPVDTKSAHETSTDAEKKDAATDLVDRFGGKKNVMIGAAAAVFIAIVVSTGQDSTPEPQGQTPQGQGQQAPVPQQQTPVPQQVQQGQPVPGQQVPGQQVPVQQGQGQPVPGQQIPPQQNAQVTLWYDEFGYIWQLQFNGNQFQGQASQNGEVLQMTGQINPQSGAVSYRVFNASSQQIGQGQGQYSDQSHIAFITYDMAGQPVGQGLFHINHPAQ